MRRTTRALGAAAALLLLASCAATGVASTGDSDTPAPTAPAVTSNSSSNASPNSSSAAAPTALDGRTFLSTEVDGHELADGTTISLTFDGDQLQATAGCNHLFATVDVTAGQLRTSGVGGTEMGCAAELMAQDTWLMQFIEAGPTWDLDAETLTLRGDGVTITLVDREVADPDRPLEGTDWVLDGFIDGDTASSVPQGMSATMRIDDGTMTFTACNRHSVAVEIGSDLDQVIMTPVGDVMSTEAACPGEVGEFDDRVGNLLLGETTVDIDADVLTVIAGTKGLTFRASPDTPDRSDIAGATGGSADNATERGAGRTYGAIRRDGP